VFLLFPHADITMIRVHTDDTIVAIATPAGRGGIGIVRLSGPDARTITLPLLRLKHPMEPGRAWFGDLIDPATSIKLDEVVVTFFAAPHSYTTDDVVEISAHGSPVLLRWLVEQCMSAGARLAEPGEFTLRAFLNGRLDLAQAEAVRDLIGSQTLMQAKSAAQQLDGALSRRLFPVKQKLLELIARLEAGVDFADDDVPVAPDQEVLNAITAIRAPLEALVESFAFGKIVHEGFTLAIVGRPNVGKSSLFNQLVERDRAIVTATPGTTRDQLTEVVAIKGIPVTLMDTAGIRTTEDEAESIGVRKSYEAMADADLVILVMDACVPEQLEDGQMLSSTAGRHILRVANKCDLPGAGHHAHADVKTSALTGAGIPELREKILATLTAGVFTPEAGYLTNARHHGLVRDSLQGLEAADQAVKDHIPHEMLLLDLYAAMRALDGITGATTADDILNMIFGKFCIGK